MHVHCILLEDGGGLLLFTHLCVTTRVNHGNLNVLLV